MHGSISLSKSGLRTSSKAREVAGNNLLSGRVGTVQLCMHVREMLHFLFWGARFLGCGVSSPYFCVNLWEGCDGARVWGTWRNGLVSSAFLIEVVSPYVALDFPRLMSSS